MPKSDALIGAMMDYLLTGQALPSEGANHYLHLHLATPTSSGTGASNEATYTGYTDMAMARDVSTWTRTGKTVTNDSAIAFPECTGVGDDEVILYASLCLADGTIRYFGALTAPGIRVTYNQRPYFPAGSIVLTEV